MHDFYTLHWQGRQLQVIDQTLLPTTVCYRTLQTVEDVYSAIATMVVRGAPAIGVAAAYGMVLAAWQVPAADLAAFQSAMANQAAYLAKARPTAVNLQWAIDRMMRLVHESMPGQQPPATDLQAPLAASPAPATDLRASAPDSGLNRDSRDNRDAAYIDQLRLRLEQEARAIHEEDIRINRAIGLHLLSLLQDGDTILTHCNAGALATTEYGTALSVFYLARERGLVLKAFADETRPRLQGARLTAFELVEAGIDTTLICDNMAAVVMAQGQIQAVIVGCDRVAANGDIANKIGTLNVSILARHYKIPFYVAAPTPTIDLDCPNGQSIPIEVRSGDEIRVIEGHAIAPSGVRIYNPSFDVTPADHITAIVTERGIVRPPLAENLALLLARQDSREIRPPALSVNSRQA